MNVNVNQQILPEYLLEMTSISMIYAGVSESKFENKDLIPKLLLFQLILWSNFYVS